MGLREFDFERDAFIDGRTGNDLRVPGGRTVMTEQDWQAAIERAKQGSPKIPTFEGSGPWQDGHIEFVGWKHSIGGVFTDGYEAMGLAFPETEIDLNDIRYLGFLRRMVTDKKGAKHWFCCVIGNEPSEVVPGQLITYDSSAIKIGAFSQKEVDRAVDVARQKLIEISALS